MERACGVAFFLPPNAAKKGSPQAPRRCHGRIARCLRPFRSGSGHCARPAECAHAPTRRRPLHDRRLADFRGSGFLEAFEGPNPSWGFGRRRPHLRVVEHRRVPTPPQRPGLRMAAIAGRRERLAEPSATRPITPGSSKNSGHRYGESTGPGCNSWPKSPCPCLDPQTGRTLVAQVYGTATARLVSGSNSTWAEAAAVEAAIVHSCGANSRRDRARAPISPLAVNVMGARALTTMDRPTWPLPAS